VLALFGVDDGEVLEFGLVAVEELGVVGDVPLLGDVGVVGVGVVEEVEDLGCVLELVEEELFRPVEDCALGAIDMRGPRCLPVADELEELLDVD
jgi:hypothetical protein